METMKKKRKQIVLPKSNEDEPDAKEFVDVDRFVCTTCEESRKVDQVYFDKCKEKHRLEKIKDFYRDLIARKMLAFWRQRCYRRKKRVFIRIQAFVRRRMAIKEYELWKRSQKRVVVIEMSSLPRYVDASVSGKYLIVVTVVDPIKRCQLFRIDKKAEAIKSEGSWQCALLLTLCCAVCLICGWFVFVSCRLFSPRDQCLCRHLGNDLHSERRRTLFRSFTSAVRDSGHVKPFQ